MPRRIRADGKIYIVPDDATPEEVNQIVSGSGGGTSQGQPSFIDRLTEIQKPDPNAPALSGKEAVKAVGNIGAGGLGVLLHPINTLESIGGTITAPFEMAAGKKFSETVPGQFVQSFKENPLETIEAGIGQAGAMPIAERLYGAPIKVIPKVAKGTLETITRTTPRAMKPLIEETRKANIYEAEKATAETEKQNRQYEEKIADIQSKAAEKRAAEVKKTGEARSSARAANKAREGVASRKEALQRGVERLDPELKSKLEKTEKTVNAEANRRYNELAKNLNPVQADGEAIQSSVLEATEKIKGTETEPTILKSISKRMELGDPLTYEDLQGYRSELGRELSKGSLPGDTYAAYKTLQSSITDEMQRIAESRGLGEQFRAARDYYRRYAETFIDRGSPVRKALDSAERGGVARALRGKDQSGIQAVAQFDSDLAQRLNNLRQYHEEATTTRVPAGAAKPIPELPPKSAVRLPSRPADVMPKVNQIESENISEAKKGSMAERAKEARKYGKHIVAYGLGLRLMWNVFSGNLSEIPADIGLSATGYGVAEAFSRLLENPRFQEILSKPTPQDIASIPEDLRGPKLKAMLDAASKKGIKVDPRLYALTGAATPQRRNVAAALRP